VTKICSRCKIEKDVNEFHAYKNRFRSRCKECRSQQAKKYYKENKDKLCQQTKKYRQENKEKRSQQAKKYFQENKESINMRNNYKYKNDTDFRLRRNLSRNFSHFMKGTKTKSTMEYFDFTLEELIEHLGPNCGGKSYHTDHIIPQALYDYTNEEDIKKCWNKRNLRTLPAKENMSKNDNLDMVLVEEYNISDLLPEKFLCDLSKDNNE